MIKLISYNPISGSIFIEEDNDFFFCDYPYLEEFKEKLNDGLNNLLTKTMKPPNI